MQPADDLQRLVDRWASLARAGGATLAWRDVGHALLARYAEPSRSYHNLDHLAECLAELDRVRGDCNDARAVELAIWFHDAIYDARAGDNELQSADLASRELAQLGEPAGCIARVRELILDTTHRSVPSTADGQLLCDIDLAILAADAPRFAEYDTAIRLEYAHVTDAAYRAGRAAVLQRFLERPAIYTTSAFASREAAARQNIQGAIALLREPVPSEHA